MDDDGTRSINDCPSMMWPDASVARGTLRKTVEGQWPRFFENRWVLRKLVFEIN